MNTANKVVQHPAAAETAAKKKFSIAKAWTPTLAKTGHVAVVRAFMRNYSTLKPYPLTSGEALLVIHLMDFKWGEEAPFPSYKTLAARMGNSVKQARRLAQSLETKGYLVREVRQAQTNRFDLTKLFTALEARVKGDA